MAVDALVAANWQRAGDKRRPRPRPIPRPGVADEDRRTRLTPAQVRRRLQDQLARQEGRALNGGR